MPGRGHPGTGEYAALPRTVSGPFLNPHELPIPAPYDRVCNRR